MTMRTPLLPSTASWRRSIRSLPFAYSAMLLLLFLAVDTSRMTMTTEAFSGIRKQCFHHGCCRRRTTTTTANPSSVSVRAFTPPPPPKLATPRSMALIYGWDDYDDPADADKKKKWDEQKGTPYVVTEDNANYSPFAPSTECPTAGTTVAEQLTGDSSRTASLARLAVRFAPPGHTGLDVRDIEQVRVLCVHRQSIEVEAVLCENHGCVSLHVPIVFPTGCSGPANDDGDDDDAQFEACVLQHLEALDGDGEDRATAVATTAASAPASSSSTTSTAGSDADLQRRLMTETRMDMPTWWVAASTFGDELAKERDHLQSILNEAEFAPELEALAKDGLKETSATSGIPYDTLKVDQARCTALGPSGIGLKVLAHRTDDEVNAAMVLDVFYPFGSGSTSTMTTPDTLRAAVLGAVAKAAEATA